MTARIDHEDQANQAAAAGKYDIAQYHALMLIAQRLAPDVATVEEQADALRVMMRDPRLDTGGRAS